MGQIHANKFLKKEPGYSKVPNTDVDCSYEIRFLTIEEYLPDPNYLEPMKNGDYPV